jgi:hypothetical protein
MQKQDRNKTIAQQASLRGKRETKLLLLIVSCGPEPSPVFSSLCRKYDESLSWRLAEPSDRLRRLRRSLDRQFGPLFIYFRHVLRHLRFFFSARARVFARFVESMPRLITPAPSLRKSRAIVCKLGYRTAATQQTCPRQHSRLLLATDLCFACLTYAPPLSSRRWPGRFRPANPLGRNGPQEPSPRSALATCGRSPDSHRPR